MKNNNKTLKKQVTSKLEDITSPKEEETEKKTPKILNLSQVEIIDETHLTIDNAKYIVAVNHRDAVDGEKIAERYNTILNKYDYIVGDWGYDQLRLKGFFDEDNHRAPFDKKIAFLEDYLYEYCNFGCAYFVLEKEKSEKQKKTKSRQRRKPREQKNNPKPNQQHKVPAKDKKAPNIKSVESKSKVEPKKHAEPKKNIEPKKNTEKPNTGFQIRKVDK